MALNGVSGSGIYFDTNHNGIWDNKDELIGLVQGAGTLASTDFIFGGG